MKTTVHWTDEGRKRERVRTVGIIRCFTSVAGQRFERTTVLLELLSDLTYVHCTRPL